MCVHSQGSPTFRQQSGWLFTTPAPFPSPQRSPRASVPFSLYSSYSEPAGGPRVPRKPHHSQQKLSRACALVGLELGVMRGPLKSKLKPGPLIPVTPRRLPSFPKDATCSAAFITPDASHSTLTTGRAWFLGPEIQTAIIPMLDEVSPHTASGFSLSRLGSFSMLPHEDSHRGARLRFSLPRQT